MYIESIVKFKTLYLHAQVGGKRNTVRCRRDGGQELRVGRESLKHVSGAATTRWGKPLNQRRDRFPRPLWELRGPGVCVRFPCLRLVLLFLLQNEVPTSSFPPCHTAAVRYDKCSNEPFSVAAAELVLRPDGYASTCLSVVTFIKGKVISHSYVSFFLSSLS